MSTPDRRSQSIKRRVVVALVGCALVTALMGAKSDLQIQELDEVEVNAKVQWPLEDYLEFPRFDSVVLSPDGTHLATGWGEDNFQRRLSILEFPSMNLHSTKLLQTYMGITDLRWLDDERLLIQPDWPLPGLWRVRNHLGTLQIRNLEGTLLQELHPPPVGTLEAFKGMQLVEEVAKRIPVAITRRVPLMANEEPGAFGPVGLVAARTDEANQMLFQTLWTGLDSYSEDLGIYRLDTAHCKQVRVAALPVRGGHVITGAGHRVALVAGVNEADEGLVYYLPEGADNRTGDWQLRVRSRSGERSLLPVAWTGQGEEYYALDGRDLPTRAVVIWNARDNTQRVLYRHPDVDMDVAWFDPAGKPWMFSGIDHDPVYWYPDPAHPLAQLHRALVRLDPHDRVDILNATDDLSKAVVRVSSGKRPPLLLVLDVTTGKSLTSMDTYPKLHGRRLSPVDAIEFRARDGLVIRGYLTTPLDHEGKPRRGVPLLVIAHNSPRDGMVDYRYVASDQYEFERQVFASRGYAVLQVNTRGTGGRGTAFEQAGDGKWGREVQDDYADGVRWAIQNGVAAAGRVCFYGTGYGAYSAMMAAAREPQLFQCVIGVGGVYDLPRLMKGDKDKYADSANLPSGIRPAIVSSELEWQLPPFCLDRSEQDARNFLKKKSARKGSPYVDWMKMLDTTLSSVQEEARRPQDIPAPLQRAVGVDLEELRAASPVAHAASIKAKLFLIKQYRDPSVPDDQLTAMQKALRAAGNPAKTATVGDEDDYRWQGFFTLKGRTDVYRNMLKFLDKQIGN